MRATKNNLSLEQPTDSLLVAGSSPGDVKSEGVSGEEGKEEEWEQVGPKNKSTITRQVGVLVM